MGGQLGGLVFASGFFFLFSFLLRFWYTGCECFQLSYFAYGEGMRHGFFGFGNYFFVLEVLWCRKRELLAGFLGRVGW